MKIKTFKIISDEAKKIVERNCKYTNFKFLKKLEI